MTSLFFAMIFYFPTYAQVTVSPETLQLQRLIENSQKQLDSLRELSRHARRDSRALEKVSQALGKLSDGLEKSIAQYKGTHVYDRALLEVQSRNEFKRTYADSERVRVGSLEPAGGEEFADGIEFQKATVAANARALDQLERIGKALADAPPGFVPKLQAQMALGDWQTTIRLSAQVTELLATIKSMREEMRLIRGEKQKRDVVSILLSGAQEQNKKQQVERK